MTRTKNRPLKFRAWDTKQKRYIMHVPVMEYMLDSKNWDHDDLDRSLEDGSGFYPQFAFEYFAFSKGEEEDRVIFEQYTGMEDCKGTSIYEGDIVLVKRCHVEEVPINTFSNTSKLIEDGEEIGVVLWSHFGLRFLVSFEHIRYDDLDDLTFVPHRYEIIGNINNNSEKVQDPTDFSK